MRTRNAVIFLLATAMLCAAAEPGKQRNWKSEEGEISFALVEFDPPVKITSELKETDGCIAASLDIYRALKAGDIEGAAALSNDPERTRTKYQRYQERIGREDFQKMFASYFSGTASYTHELVIGAHHLLLIEDADDGTIAAQFYERLDGKFLVDEKPSPERDQLGKLFMAVREGKLKL